MSLHEFQLLTPFSCYVYCHKTQFHHKLSSNMKCIDSGSYTIIIKVNIRKWSLVIIRSVLLSVGTTACFSYEVDFHWHGSNK